MAYLFAVPLAFLGTTELLVILAIIIILFGASKIPSLMRGVGKGIVEFKEGMNEAKKIGVEDDKSGGEKKEIEAPKEEKAEEKSAN